MRGAARCAVRFRSRVGMTHFVLGMEKPGSKLHKKETCEVRRAVHWRPAGVLLFCCFCLQAGPTFSTPTPARGCVRSAA